MLKVGDKFKVVDRDFTNLATEVNPADIKYFTISRISKRYYSAVSYDNHWPANPSYWAIEMFDKYIRTGQIIVLNEYDGIYKDEI